MSRALKLRLALTLTAAALLVGLVIAPAAAAPPPAPLSDTASDICAKLTGYWSLDETSGTRLDSTANNLDLTDVNTVGYTTGKQGNAADFEKDNFESLTHAHDALFARGAWDIELGGWFKLESVNNWMTLIAKRTSGNTDWRLYLNGTNQLVWSIADSGSVTASAFGALSADTWYFISAWYDHTGATIYLEINGNQYSNSTSGSGTDYGSGVRFGVVNEAENPYDGLMDEVYWVKENSLTGTEHTWLENSGSGRDYDEICTGATPTPTITNTPDPNATATPDPIEIRGTLPSSGADYLINRSASFGEMFIGVGLMAIAVIGLVLLFSQVAGRLL